jgi:hypothetical protein
MWHNWDIPERQ